MVCMCIFELAPSLLVPGRWVLDEYAISRCRSGSCALWVLGCDNRPRKESRGAGREDRHHTRGASCPRPEDTLEPDGLGGPRGEFL